jgi:hypothetical protein
MRIGERAIGRLSWLPWGLSLLVTGGTATLTLLNRTRGRAAGSLVGGALFLTLILTVATVGALIGWQRPGNAVGWLFVALALGFAIVSLADEYVRFALFNRSGALPGGAAPAWVSSWLGGGPALAPVALLFLVYPNGRLLSRRWRVVGWLVAASGALSLATSFAPGPLPNAAWSEPVDNPFGIDGASGLLGPLNAAGLALLALTLVASVVSLGQRFRRSRESSASSLSG